MVLNSRMDWAVSARRSRSEEGTPPANTTNGKPKPRRPARTVITIMSGLLAARQIKRQDTHGQTTNDHLRLQRGIFCEKSPAGRLLVLHEGAAHHHQRGRR